MFIKKISIKNFRIFSDTCNFEVDEFNIPDNVNEGSGLTLIVGENACGKTTILDALALPVLTYKAEDFSLNDFYNPTNKCEINIYSDKNYEFARTMPGNKYRGKGFSFSSGVRSRGTNSYLSSIVVKDQKYIRADSETKPEDTSPDIRLNVNNPWSGSRFSENDYLFLDDKRLFQTRIGTYNSTRFDRLMEDLDYQYIKTEGKPINLVEKVNENVTGSENEFLVEAIEKFKIICNIDLSLNLIDNWKPHAKAFIGVQKDNFQQIRLDMLGSGYEMIFALLYSFYLSKQSAKDLIIFIDEPELHLHPKLQEKFVNILLELSKEIQIILTTHSPLFVKQALYNEKVKFIVLRNKDNKIEKAEIEERVLSFVSSNEVNFIAFDLPTEEYHNELYEELISLKGQVSITDKSGNPKIITKGIKEFDIDYFQTEKGETRTSPWMGYPNEVSVHTFIRNQIHHQKENGKTRTQELKLSIEKMREYIKEII